MGRRENGGGVGGGQHGGKLTRFHESGSGTGHGIRNGAGGASGVHLRSCWKAVSGHIYETTERNLFEISRGQMMEHTIDDKLYHQQQSRRRKSMISKLIPKLCVRVRVCVLHVRYLTRRCAIENTTRLGAKISCYTSQRGGGSSKFVGIRNVYTSKYDAFDKTGVGFMVYIRYFKFLYCLKK